MSFHARLDEAGLPPVDLSRDLIHESHVPMEAFSLAMLNINGLAVSDLVSTRVCSKSKVAASPSAESSFSTSGFPASHAPAASIPSETPGNYDAYYRSILENTHLSLNEALVALDNVSDVPLKVLSSPDNRNAMQERLQAMGALTTFKIQDFDMEPVAGSRFTIGISIVINGQTVIATGLSDSQKKNAKQAAAYVMRRKIAYLEDRSKRLDSSYHLYNPRTPAMNPNASNFAKSSSNSASFASNFPGMHAFPPGKSLLGVDPSLPSKAGGNGSVPKALHGLMPHSTPAASPSAAAAAGAGGAYLGSLFDSAHSSSSAATGAGGGSSATKTPASAAVASMTTSLIAALAEARPASASVPASSTTFTPAQGQGQGQGYGHGPGAGYGHGEGLTNGLKDIIPVPIGLDVPPITVVPTAPWAPLPAETRRVPCTHATSTSANDSKGRKSRGRGGRGVMAQSQLLLSLSTRSPSLNDMRPLRLLRRGVAAFLTETARRPRQPSALMAATTVADDLVVGATAAGMMRLVLFALVAAPPPPTFVGGKFVESDDEDDDVEGEAEGEGEGEVEGEGEGADKVRPTRQSLRRNARPVVLVQEPVSPETIQLLVSLGITPVSLPHDNPPFSPPSRTALSVLLAKHRPRAVLLSSASGPLPTPSTPAQPLWEIASLCVAAGAWVIVDETSSIIAESAASVSVAELAAAAALASGAGPDDVAAAAAGAASVLAATGAGKGGADEDVGPEVLRAATVCRIIENMQMNELTRAHSLAMSSLDGDAETPNNDDDADDAAAADARYLRVISSISEGILTSLASSSRARSLPQGIPRPRCPASKYGVPLFPLAPIVSIGSLPSMAPLGSLAWVEAHPAVAGYLSTVARSVPSLRREVAVQPLVAAMASRVLDMRAREETPIQYASMESGTVSTSPPPLPQHQHQHQGNMSSIGIGLGPNANAGVDAGFGSLNTVSNINSFGFQTLDANSQHVNPVFDSYSFNTITPMHTTSSSSSSGGGTEAPKPQWKFVPPTSARAGTLAALWVHSALVGASVVRAAAAAAACLQQCSELWVVGPSSLSSSSTATSAAAAEAEAASPAAVAAAAIAATAAGVGSVWVTVLPNSGSDSLASAAVKVAMKAMSDRYGQGKMSDAARLHAENADVSLLLHRIRHRVTVVPASLCVAPQSPLAALAARSFVLRCGGASHAEVEEAARAVAKAVVELFGNTTEA